MPAEMQTATDIEPTDTDATMLLSEPVETGVDRGERPRPRLPSVTTSFPRRPSGFGFPNPLAAAVGVAGAATDALTAAVASVPRDKVLFYGGVAVLGVVGVVDWPVAAVIAAGTYVASRSRGGSSADVRDAVPDPLPAASSA